MHNVMMLDGCPACGQPVGYYRRDFGKELWNVKDMACCWSCGFDYRGSESQQPLFYSAEIRSVYTKLLKSLLELETPSDCFDASFFQVLHQLVRVMCTKLNHGKLEAYLAEQLDTHSVNIELGREGVESRGLDERYHLIMLGLWLLADIKPRLTAAWRNKTVRYNLLTKDMKPVPKWYGELVSCFSDWRALKKIE
jgi:hypothetical protein